MLLLPVSRLLFSGISIGGAVEVDVEKKTHM